MTPYLFKQYHIDTSLITLSLSLSLSHRYTLLDGAGGGRRGA